jgi:hypothetical protein
MRAAPVSQSLTRSGVTYPTKLLLAFRSGDRCAFPGCDTALTVDGQQSGPVLTGEAAHIAGDNDGAARYDPAMTDEQRNHYDNLIYMCGDHHTRIDKQEADFPDTLLTEIKAEHENRVRDAMAEAFAKVGFLELEQATLWIMQVEPNQTSQDFSLIPPEDKIRKNDLSTGSRGVITMGLGVARDVRRYVESVSQTDSDFPECLKAGFVAEYYRLRQQGYTGDALFNLMCSFAQRGFDTQVRKAAGLACLVYLFEACEVFEK